MKNSQLPIRHESTSRNFCSPSLISPPAFGRGGWGVATLLLAALLIFVGSASATDYSWKTAASGTWSATASWNPTGTPNLVGDTVAITNGYSTATKTVTLDVSSPNVSSIILSNGVSPFNGWRITPSTTAGITDSNINMFYNPSSPKNVTIREDSTNDIAASSRITANLTLNTNLDITVAANSQILFGQIRGANFTVTKYGLGTVDISGVPTAGPNNSFSNLVIVAGTFMADCIGANVNTLCPGGIVINSGATLKYARVGQQVATNCAIINNGTYDLNGSGATTIATLAGSGVITDFKTTGATNTLTLAGAGNSTFSGNILNGTITNILGLVKIGASTLTLAGTNIMGGSTTISNTSTLLVNGLQAGAGTVNILASATLGGTGTILSPVTLTGTLLAGNNGGTLTVSNVTGTGSVIVSNANLSVVGQVGTSGSAVSSVYYNNSTNTFTLNSGSTAPSIYTTNLNVDGINNTIGINFPNPVNGQYPLIAAASIGGLNGFTGLNLSVPAGMVAYLSNNVVNASIDLVITSAGALTWRGTPNGNWNIGTTANWFNGVSSATYTESGGAGSFVNFDDTLTGTPAVNLTTTLTPLGINVSGTNNYSFTGSGLINGSASLVKTGSGTLTIANTASNTYSGSITISNGAISVGNGGTAGNIGAASVANSGSLIFNRSDVVTFGNVITGTGVLVNQGTGTTILTQTNAGNSPLTINAGILALSTSGTRIPSGAITGAGALGVIGGGTVILTNNNNTYSGGDTIFSGTLQFGDGSGNGVLTGGNLTNNGAVIFNFPTGVIDNNNISGSGSLSSIGSDLTLTGNNTYTGTTLQKSGTLYVGSVTAISTNSALTLGNMNGNPASLNASNYSVVVPSLTVVGYNAASPSNYITLGSGQKLTVNGNFSVGDTNGTISGAGATMSLSFVTPDSSCGLTVNTNGGIIQLGLCQAGAGSPGSPNWLNTDLSALGFFTANLGAAGALNVGELNTATGGNVSAYDNLTLAQTNVLNLGTLRVGTGGKGFNPKLFLGSASNNLNVNTIIIGANRDVGTLAFTGGSGSVTLRGFAGGTSAAVLNIGANIADSTSGAATNTVDFTGHNVDLLISTLTLGNQPARVGPWVQTFSFDTGVLNVTDVELSQAGKTNYGSSTLNLHGGTSIFGNVNFLKDNTNTVAGNLATLDIASNAVVTVATNLLKGGAGLATLNVADSTLTANGAVGAATNQIDFITFSNSTVNLNLASTPVTAPVQTTNLTIYSTKLYVSGTGLVVGQFPLLAYTNGILNGSGFGGLTLTNLPSVTAYLSNNVANSSIDLVVTSAPTTASTNAYLNSLVLAPALTFTPSFASTTFGYAATETNLASPTVTVVNADLTATNKLIYNNTTNLLGSGTASAPLTLTLGVTNVVTVQVTAQDGVTVKTYTVNVVEQPSQTKPLLTNLVSGSTLTLSWPADHLGYRLLVQTNNLNLGVSGNISDWATVPGSTSVTTKNITILTTNLNEYYQLVYP